MYQSRRAGDEAKKRKSPAKSGRVGITEYMPWCTCSRLGFHFFKKKEISKFFIVMINNIDDRTSFRPIWSVIILVTGLSGVQ